MAREQYLLHSGEDEIHNKEKEIKLVTKKDKWKNFWFYHTKHVIVAICLCVLIGGGIYEIVTKIEPDYTIAFLTDNAYTPEECIQELEDAFALYAQDRNGDGRVVVSVTTYDLALGANSVYADPEMQTANMVKFAGDVQTQESVIFIMNDASEEYCKVEAGVAFENFADGSYKIPLKDLPIVQEMEYGVLLEDFNFYIRDFSEFDTEEESMAEFIQSGKDLLDAFVHGEA